MSLTFKLLSSPPMNRSAALSSKGPPARICMWLGPPAVGSNTMYWSVLKEESGFNIIELVLVITPVIFTSPFTSKATDGDAVPIPIFPS